MKFVCPVCGYVYEGDAAPEKCPQCGVPGSKFTVIDDNGSKLVFADEHKIGVGRLEGVPEEIVEGLRANFTGECTEVGMYLAMARAAHREGYPEVGLYYEKAAWEEAEHAAKFAELLGEVVSPSTKENLTKRVEAEHGATAGKLDLAKKAKALNLDATTTQFTKWQRTRQDTERLSRVFSTDTSSDPRNRLNKGFTGAVAEMRLPFLLYFNRRKT